MPLVKSGREKKKNKPTKHVCCCRCAFSTYVLSPTFTSYTSLWMKVFGADAWYKIPLTGTIEGSVGVMAASVGSTHWSWQTFINIWKKTKQCCSEITCCSWSFHQSFLSVCQSLHLVNLLHRSRCDRFYTLKFQLMLKTGNVLKSLLLV